MLASRVSVDENHLKTKLFENDNHVKLYGISLPEIFSNTIITGAIIAFSNSSRVVRKRPKKIGMGFNCVVRTSCFKAKS